MAWGQERQALQIVYGLVVLTAVQRQERQLGLGKIKPLVTQSHPLASVPPCHARFDRMAKMARREASQEVGHTGLLTSLEATCPAWHTRASFEAYRRGAGVGSRWAAGRAQPRFRPVPPP